MLTRRDLKQLLKTHGVCYDAIEIAGQATSDLRQAARIEKITEMYRRKDPGLIARDLYLQIIGLGGPTPWDPDRVATNRYIHNGSEWRAAIEMALAGLLARRKAYVVRGLWDKPNPRVIRITTYPEEGYVSEIEIRPAVDDGRLVIAAYEKGGNGEGWVKLGSATFAGVPPIWRENAARRIIEGAARSLYEEGSHPDEIIELIRVAGEELMAAKKELAAIK